MKTFVDCGSYEELDPLTEKELAHIKDQWWCGIAGERIEAGDIVVLRKGLLWRHGAVSTEAKDQGE